MPAVSTKRKMWPLRSTISSTASRVVPAMGLTMARLDLREGVEEGGLADVGAADDGDLGLAGLVLAVGAEFAGGP